ncbi:ShlB/FhaC/HecB family hemolysin secretion/activation protein [Comamonas sp. CMM02]|uniref:ShlB/FhaC/HecB family hemolysin secretion/activation protein n=1 Tax=Comamonas sp. CMM02 TaxID=2769307 RepID=UPI00177C4197|nr:ShlB/FhaC/HecB family hemolysin secretion/activation protein [Comamonas sp. CMM02]MBD9403249.1 ShlB/FhaC/HecB family hemolysin secretion/activation protein [Comamonas sp. CMM02]
MPIKRTDPRLLVWLCSICTATFVFGQAPTGGPLVNVPQPSSPRPSSDISAEIDTPSALQLSKQLQTRLTLSTTLQVNRIDISGVKTIAFDDVAALFQPLSGQQASIEQLAAAATQATALYHKAGFPLSFFYLPEQSFDQGIVKVIAVEGHISRVEVTGDTGKSGALLAQLTQPLLESRPLEGEVFTKQTLLMARMLSLQVGAQAAMPTTTDGATPLLLNVKQDPIVFTVGADLRQGDPKAVANLTLNDPLWGGSQWQLSSLIDDPKDERFISLSMNQWLNAQGTTLQASISDFKGHDNFLGNTLQDVTTQRKAELVVMHPLQLSSTGSTVIGAGFFGLNYQKTYNFPDLGIELNSREKVRALQAHLIWQKTSPQSQQNLSASFTQGLNIWGAGWKNLNNANLVNSINPAKFDFSRLSMDYAVRWRFLNQMGLAMGVGGQYTPHILPISERVAFGGARYGRGYRAGEAAGDQGLGVSLEINRHFPIKDGKWLKHWEPYLMYEHAKTWFHASDFMGQKLRSSSFGIRLGDNRYYALDLAVSKPQGDKSPYNPEQKVRYSLSLTYQLDL